MDSITTSLNLADRNSARERDMALAARVRRGDQSAFAELHRLYHRRVIAFACKRLGDSCEAEDVAQDVFLRVHRGLPYFRGEARLSTWIYRIVANVCLQDHGRTPKTAPLDEERGNSALAAADRQFTDLEVRDRLEKAIARLPANYRLLVAAHYLRGVQYEELAEALQLPLGTVKTQLYRAKQQLRRLLETDLR